MQKMWNGDETVKEEARGKNFFNQTRIKGMNEDVVAETICYSKGRKGFSLRSPALVTNIYMPE